MTKAANSFQTDEQSAENQARICAYIIDWQINDLKESIQLSANGVVFANFFYKSVWRFLFFKIIFHKNWNAAAKNLSFISKFYRLSRGQKTRLKRRLSREPYATARQFV